MTDTSKARPTIEFLAMMQDGPIKKFQLIKFYGAFIRAAGLDPNKMSCAEIDATLAHIRTQF